MTSQGLISKIHCTLSANQKKKKQVNVLTIIITGIIESNFGFYHPAGETMT